MIANKYVIRSGVGRSDKYLPSFDKALIEAGVGNYNLVRLSSILPARCKEVQEIDLQEGSLLPTAYATITSSEAGEMIASAIGVGISADDSQVGVTMEYSSKGETKEECEIIVMEMIKEAFVARGWKMKEFKTKAVEAIAEEGETVTTFACIAEW